MSNDKRYIVSDPEILGGTAVFVGTRVPFSFLMEYLERGSSIEDFIVDYPSVTKQLASKALEEAATVVDQFVHARVA